MVMLIIANTNKNMNRHIRTDYKNIHFYDENSKLSNKREGNSIPGVQEASPLWSEFPSLLLLILLFSS